MVMNKYDNAPDEVTIKLSYEDFISITGVSNPENFAHGLRVNHSGVWAIRPDRPEFLSKTELNVLRPLKGWDEPILQFPCSLDELRDFFEEALMGDCHESLDDFQVDLKSTCMIADEKDAVEGIEIDDLAANPAIKQKKPKATAKRKQPNKKGYRNPLNMFMDDALLEYWKHQSKDPNIISDLLEKVKQGMTNRIGKTWYYVVDTRISAERHLTLNEKKGDGIDYPFKKVQRAFDDRKAVRFYRTMEATAEIPS